MSDVADVGALLGGIGAMLAALAAIATLYVTVKRGSDRENKRTAAVAVEVAQDETVTPIERERGEAQ